MRHPSKTLDLGVSAFFERMPSSSCQTKAADACRNTLSLSLADNDSSTACIAISAAPAFNLDDSDSEDSVHQFFGRRGLPGQENDDIDDVFADDGGLLMGSGIPGSPFAVAARTRPPSPRRVIGARPLPFRSAASEPLASSPQSRSRKKRLTGDRPQSQGQLALDSDDHDDDSDLMEMVCGDRQPEKRRRLAQPADAAAAASSPPWSRLRPLGDASNRRLSRCMSENCGLGCPPAAASAVSMDTARIDKAIASIDSLNLIGNSEQGHALPTVKELDFGIRYVTPLTVSRLLDGQYADRVREFDIVDCRYPYEYRGGHIRGALNLYRPEEVLERLLTLPEVGRTSGRVIIFHCEFSSERAPRMARLLRQRDREMNSHNYPQLHYPELYLLQGGYKAFYEAHKDDCNPSAYTRMADPQHKEELVHFHRLGRAWERQNSRTKHSRLQRMMGSPLLM